MEERKFCQCCAMPLDRPEDAGTEQDGAPSEYYCRYCYQKGTFTAPDATMDDIIAFNLKFNAGNLTDRGLKMDIGCDKIKEQTRRYTGGPICLIRRPAEKK